MYRMDAVIGPGESQDAVFREVLPLVEAAFDGSSAAALVYGSHKSGKAHTVFGGSQIPPAAQSRSCCSARPLLTVHEQRFALGGRGAMS